MSPFVVTAKGFLPVALARAVSSGPTLPCLTACVAVLASLMAASGRRYLLWLLFGETLALGLRGLAAVFGLLALAAELLEKRTLAVIAGPLLLGGLASAPSWFGEDVHCAWAIVAISGALVYLAKEWLQLGRGQLAAVRRAGWIFLAGVAACAGIQVHAARLGFRNQTPCPQIVSGPPGSHAVSLTFDDGPDPLYTPKVLEILRRTGVRATFFMVGEKVEFHPELAALVASEGHEVGNHSYTHRNLSRLGRQQLDLEIEWTQEAIERTCGIRPLLFRPPRGLGNAILYELLAQKGLTLALFSVSSRDWLQPASNGIVSSVSRTLAGGEIVLFHDSGNSVRSSGASRVSTLAALPGVIKAVKARGLQFVTVSEMIALGGEQGWNMGIAVRRPPENGRRDAAESDFPGRPLAGFCGLH